MLSAGKGVDPKSLHIGHLWRGGRVFLFDWLYEVLGHGRGGVFGALPGSAASGRGGQGYEAELE